MAINDIVNTSLLFEPYNWLTVILMLAIATMALCLLMAPLGTIGGLMQVF